MNPPESPTSGSGETAKHWQMQYVEREKAKHDIIVLVIETRKQKGSRYNILRKDFPTLK
jgi:hypothetical protein